MEEFTILDPAERDYYILGNDGEVKIIHDFFKWVKWIGKADLERCIARDEIGRFTVSTVFLALDYSFGNHKFDAPVLFETISFSRRKRMELLSGLPKKYNKMIGRTKRYATRAEAEKGHAEVVKKLKKRNEDSIRKNKIS